MAKKIKSCASCNQPINNQLYTDLAFVPLATLKGELCFDCAYWKQKLAHLPSNQWVIDGKIYQIREYFNNETRRLHDYSLTFAVDKDNAVHKISSAKFVDTIPEKLRSDVPNEYSFVSYHTAKRIMQYGSKQCLMKGCWDRKSCFWFQIDEAKDGAYNEIPEDYVAGSENCPSYIDKQLMYKP